MAVPSQNLTPGRIWKTYWRFGSSYFQLVASSGESVSWSDTASRPSIPLIATVCALASNAVAMSRPTIVEVDSAQDRLGMSLADSLAPAEELAPGLPPEPLELPHAASTPGKASAAPPIPSPRSS